MKNPDLTYRRDGMFTRFFAETEVGAVAWRQIAEQCEGVAAVFCWQEADTLRQLRAAGYVVRMAKTPEMTIDEILSELEA